MLSLGSCARQETRDGLSAYFALLAGVPLRTSAQPANRYQFPGLGHHAEPWVRGAGIGAPSGPFVGLQGTPTGDNRSKFRPSGQESLCQDIIWTQALGLKLVGAQAS